MCPNACSRHGRCNGVTGKCECDVGYAGVDCSQPTCPDCGNGGECGDGMSCLCQIGFEGPTCQDKACDSQCTSNGGKCRNGECLCPSGLIGLECAIKADVCPKMCSGNGICDEYNRVCKCDEGYFGDDCSLSLCTKGCNEPNGRCFNGTCYCAPNYSGDTCASKECPNNCHGHGKCDDETRVCMCEPGYTGVDCSLLTCGGELADCHQHGHCSNGTCVCNKGYSGRDCSLIQGMDHACTSSCSSHCLSLCAVVYKEKGLQESKRCYVDCNTKCIANCVASSAEADSHTEIRE